MASNWRNPNHINTVNQPAASGIAAGRPGVSSTTAIPAPGFGTTSSASFAIVRAPGTRRPSLEALLAIPPPLTQRAASPYIGGAAATMASLATAGLVPESPQPRRPSADRLTVGNLAPVVAASYVSEERKMSRIMEWVNKVEDEIL